MKTAVNYDTAKFPAGEVFKGHSEQQMDKQNSRLIAHHRLTTSDRALDDPIYRNFNQQDHQGVEDVRIQLIDKLALRDREAQWAYRLKTISPLGIDSDDFFSKRNPRKDLCK